jgi:glutaredoxin
MNYLLFSYPNCQKCEDLKAFLQTADLEGEDLNLVRREGKLKIRAFIKDLKRDDKGAIIIPTLVLVEEGKTAAVLNSREELEDWLKSRG